MKPVHWQWAEGRWLAGLAAAGLAIGLVSAGVRFSLIANPELSWLNQAAALAWLAAAGAGFALLDSGRGLAAGVGLIASLGYAVMGLKYGPGLAVGLAAAALAASLALVFANRRTRPLGDSANEIGQALVGSLLGTAATLVRLPAGAAPMILLGMQTYHAGNWMAPLVGLGVPLAQATLAGLHLARRGLGLTGLAGEGRLAGYLAGQVGLKADQAAPFVWLTAGLLGAAGLWLTRFAPLPAHLALAAVVLLAILALNYRRLTAIGWRPLAVYAWAAGVLLLFLLSLKYWTLNRFFPGVMPGYPGWDFYTIPRAFDYMLHGVTMYHPAPEIYQSAYGPYATEPFSPHPLLAVLPGAILFALPPQAAYLGFVAFSVAALGALAWAYARWAANAWQSSLIMLFMLASWPIYGMLWMGQMHIFPVIAFGLIGLGLFMALAGRPRWETPFIAGFLISLFSKPVVLMLLPVMLVARPTRRAAIIITAVYAAVSLAFVVVPPLNPGQAPLADLLAGRASVTEFVESANLYHWVYLGWRGAWVATNWREAFSLPVLLNVLVPEAVAGPVGQGLMLALVGYLGWAVARVRSRRWNVILALLAALMVNTAYFYSYSLVFEYQYTTLALVPVGLLLLRSSVNDRRFKQFCLAGLALYIPFLLPSAYALVVPHPVPDVFWDYSTETLAQMTIFRASRVLPALALGIVLLLAAGRARLLAQQAPPDLPAEGVA